MKINEDRIKQIEERCAKATPNWTAELNRDHFSAAPNVRSPEGAICGFFWLGHDYVNGDDAGNAKREAAMVATVEANAEFVAEARQDIPDLLSDLRELHAELLELRRAQNWIRVTPEAMPPEGELVSVYQLYGAALWQDGKWWAGHRWNPLMWEPEFWCSIKPPPPSPVREETPKP